MLRQTQREQLVLVQMPNLNLYNIQMKAGKNKQLDNLLINLNEAPQPPDFPLAKTYQKRHSLTSEPFTFIGVQEYTKFGPGVKLYFSALKYTVVLFLILSIAAIPSLITNYRGNGLSLYGKSWQQTILRFSLANQQSLYLTDIDLSLEQELKRVENVKINQMIIIANDVFCSLIFLAFLIFWQIKSRQIISQIVRKNAPPSYHTLIVELPHENIKKQELMEHFSQFGAVQQIEFVRDYGNFLLQLRDFIQLIEKHNQQLAIQKKQTYYNEIQESYDRIKSVYRLSSQYRKGDPFPKIKAFVSFQDQQLAQKVNKLYMFNLQNMNLSVEGNMIKVKKCLVQPLSIIWQNYHLKDPNQYMRSCCFVLVVGFLLLITLFGVFIVSLHANNMNGDIDQFSLSFEDKNITFLEAKKSNDSAVIFAFCSSITYKTFQLQYYSLCSQYFKHFQKHWFYIGTLALTNCAFALILIRIVFTITELRRFRTVSQKRRFMILSIFLTYLISSSLLILLIRAEIKWQGGSFSLVRWAQTSFPDLTPKRQFNVYGQMTRKWYLQIGKLLLANYVLTLNLFPWLYVIEEWTMQIFRFLWARNGSTLKIMHDRILDKEFYWQFYYSVQLNSIYFCLFFSLAFPIFYFLCFIAILSLLWTSKIIFKSFTKQPQVFDHKINSFIFQACSASLVLHQITSVYTLTVNQIFPQSQSSLMSFSSIKIIYSVLAIFLIFVIVNIKKISQLVQRKIYSKKEQLMMTEQINSTFGADRQQKKKRITKIPIKSRNNSYLSSYKMDDNPYYNNLSYFLLILEQIMANRPLQLIPHHRNKDQHRNLSLNEPNFHIFQLQQGESQRNLSI